MSDPMEGARADSHLEQLARALDEALQGSAGAGSSGLDEVDERFVADLVALCRGADTHKLSGDALFSDASRQRAGVPILAEFQVLSELGQGGFARVLLAWDPALGRHVALKTIRRDLPDDRREDLTRHLVADARRMAEVEHPNVLPIHALLMVEGLPHLVMPFVPGGSIEDLVALEGRMSWARAGRYVADVAEALLEVHRSGVVHRDVKPGNILWDDRRDEALLTDFGLAVRLEDGAPEWGGTIPFMAPEAFDGEVGPGVDVYSLAATLYCLLTEHPPFRVPRGTRAPRDNAGLRRRIERELRPLIERGLPVPDVHMRVVPEALESLIRAGLAPDPAGRPSMAEVAWRLRGVLNRELAAGLPGPPLPAGRAPGDDLEIRVARIDAGGRVTQLAGSRPSEDGGRARDIRLVPPAPERVLLCTGDALRVNVWSRHDGYLILFNVGPGGDLNLLRPADPAARAWSAVRGGRAVHVDGLRVASPAGRERLVALWCRRPRALRLGELASFGGGDRTPRASSSLRATRDIVRIQEGLRDLPPDDWRSAVLELEHRE